MKEALRRESMKVPCGTSLLVCEALVVQKKKVRQANDCGKVC